MLAGGFIVIVTLLFGAMGRDDPAQDPLFAVKGGASAEDLLQWLLNLFFCPSWL